MEALMTRMRLVRRRLSWLALIPACLIATTSAPLEAAEPERPNIVLILADDFGWGDLGCYGGKIARTPHLDRMASEGVRFTQFYVASPICSPSRCGIITGQFPARWRITSYLQTRAGNQACEMADFLDPAAPSLPRTLKQAGYATAHIGKWHLGGGRDVVNPPRFKEYGYDLGIGTWESPEPHPDLTARDWIWSDDDKVKRWDRTKWMVDQTLGFLKENASRPCFVNLWLDDTHTPWVPSAEDQAKKRPSSRPMFKKVTEEMDRQLGRLLQALRDPKAKPGPSRPTLVLFVGDNGPLPTFGQERTGGLRGSKLSLYEGGIRVPGMAWGPGLVASGVTNSATVFDSVDLLPSLCKLAAAPLPQGYEPDGEDLSEALLGHGAPTRTKRLFWEYGRNAKSFAYPKDPHHRSPNVAVRDGDWKLLINADGRGAELYDVAADPREEHDLAAARPEVSRRLTKAALTWRRALPGPH
jgi:arylsulfatase A-like enzyme